MHSPDKRGKVVKKKVATANLKHKEYLAWHKKNRLTHPELYVYVPKKKEKKHDGAIESVPRYGGVIYD